MKNGMKRRVMAVMLAVMMVTLQSGTAFAAEGKDPVSGDQIIGEGAAEAPAQEKEDGTSVSADEKPEPESGETAPGTDEPVSGDAVSGDTIGEGSGEDPAGEQVSDDGISEIVSDDTVSDGSLPFGLKGMPEGYSLSEKQVEGKKNITGHDVLSIMDTLTAGEDYVADEVIFSCDDPEYAKIVAEAYNGTLKSCELGVAVIKLDTDRVTVKEAVTAGADITTTLPPVDANYLTKLTDPIPSEGKIWENSDPFDDAGIMAAKKKAIDKLTWSYWKDRFKDPGLDPGATFTDIYNGGITKSCYQWMHEAVGSYAAWGMTRGEGVTVAVLDSGVYADHPDLAGQVTTRKVGDFEPVDVTGHGTHVAGIIGASSNTVGGVGIAPGAKILSYPIFQGLSATYDAQAMAINDVANNGEIRAQVINMSIGGPVYSQTVQDAINKAYNAGITICVAMGNEHASDIEYPAACDNVIAVSAMDESWQKSDFSTFGPWADIAAPGTAIYSTWNGHTTENTGKDMVLWASMNGTSMACPVVAGVCALYISAKGGTADPDEVEKAIKKTATKVSSPYRIGAGMINAENLLKPLEDTVAPLIALPETVSANQAITFGSTAKGGTLGYIYTVNGKKPNASLGDVKEGFYVEAGDDGTAKVSIAALLDNGLPAGEAGKIMVSRITGLGTMTDPAEQSITVAGGATAGMSITGSNVLAKGKSLTYKLNRKLPKDSVTWKIEGAPAGVAINAKSGKVTSKASSSGSFTVVAETTAGNVSKKVDLVEGATGVTLLAPAADKDPNKEVNIPVNARNGNLRSARLYNVDVKNTARVENVLKLDGKAVGNTAPVEFSSSKPSVATVDGTGKVTAKKAGSVKITCRTTDGSNKKAVVSIKVIVPVSRLDMYLDRGMQAVGYGTNMKIRAAIGSAYGKPTIKKVEWEAVRVTGFTAGGSKDVTDEIKSAGLIRLTNGKIKVDKKIASLDSYRYFEAAVKVKATDGSGITYEKTFTVLPSTTVLRANPENELIKNNTIIVEASGGTDVLTGVFFSGNLRVQGEIRSSNPAVASGYMTGFAGVTNGDLTGYSCVITTGKKGTAILTMHATDGSGKKAKLKVITK